MNRFLVVACLTAGLGTSANAYLIFGTSYYSTTNVGLSGGFVLNTKSGVAQQLWTGASNKKVVGLAADDANRILYGNDSARLYKWTYNSIGTQPTQINGLYRLGTDGKIYATGVYGLAFANGNLYGWTNYNAGSGGITKDGIYRIDPTVTTSATQNMFLLWEQTSTNYKFHGLEFNAADGLFYASNSTSDASLRGIYTIDAFGTGAITKVADIDPWLTEPDGLAIGDGHIWMSQKLSGDTILKIAGYNLTTHEYDQFFALDGFPTTGYYTGLAWSDTVVPEPATIGALALGVLGLVRRKRRN